MGCLVSTTNFDKETSAPTPLHESSPPPHHSLLEEETVVKEVLSETPKSTLPVPRFSNNGASPKNPTFPSPNGRQNFGFVKNPRTGFNSQSQSGELSEDAASEICSSLGDRDDDVSKIRNRSPAKYRNRERMVGNSPGKRTQPSPGRARPGSGSEMCQGRRSTSPATRTTRSMSSPGARRSTPGRVASARSVDDHINYRDREAKLAQTNHESLENPLVSLECFIFL